MKGESGYIQLSNINKEKIMSKIEEIAKFLDGNEKAFDLSEFGLGVPSFRVKSAPLNDDVKDEVVVFMGDKISRKVKLDNKGRLALGDEALHDGEYFLVGKKDDVKYILKDFPSALVVYKETGCSVAVYMTDDNLSGVVKTFTGAVVVAGYSDRESAMLKASDVCYINACGDDKEEKDVLGTRKFDTVKEYYRAGGDVNVMLKTGAESRLMPLWWALKRARRPSWIIDGVLPDAPGLAILYSAPNVGKTYLVIDMALTIATGRTEWFGHKVKGGKVLYLCGEGNKSFFSRIKCWMQENDEEEPENIRFIYEKKLFNFDQQTDYDEFIKCLETRCSEENPKLVIVDTMNLYMSRDENSTEETSCFLKSLKTFCSKFNCTVLLVHHTGLKEDRRERGSSTIRGSVDSSIMLTDDKGIKKIEQVKNRNGELFESMYFVLEKHAVKSFDSDNDEDEEPVIDCIVRQIDAPQKVSYSKGEAFIASFCLERYEKNLEWGSFTRSDLIEFGKKVLPNIPVSVTTQLNPRQNGKLLNTLLRDGVLKEVEGDDINSMGKVDERYELVSERLINLIESRIAEAQTATGNSDEDK